MEDSLLHEAVEELKRVEHLVYVSLKYTRTVDVLMNIINRMVEAYEYTINAVLDNELEKNKLPFLPDTPLERATLLKDHYKDLEDDEEGGNVIKDNLSIYLLLRKVQKSVPERENEYRRHVTLITFINNHEERIDIDIITNYYLHIKHFVEHASKLLDEEE